MVKICTTVYPPANEPLYKEHFDVFGFPLSDFQKHAIEAIVTGNHILVCAPTGNGKSLPAEFAIQYFVGMKKKVIYTSPIKALSNQKYYDFTQKYPHIKFGLLTGDIKLNPEADVLIMTAEILQNTLYKKKNDAGKNPALLAFDMDFDNELACLIQDEVHSINLEERGHVWESIFMLLPRHVQNVMLSATLDSPEKFAEWIENLSPNKPDKSVVYLTTVKERVVPLTHSSFITAPSGIFKAIKDKTLEAQIRGVINKPLVIQDSKNVFNETNYTVIKKMLDLFESKKVSVKRPFVLNQVCRYMVENNLLPCACFILSRKQIEIAAKEVTAILLEDDSKVPYIVRRECEQILRSKIPNYQEYLELPEYVNMVALLEKGIGTHHAGTMPILKEIVELLFSKGYIKLLFCSETFSMGLNMPIKTVIFTDLYKYDGAHFRLLHGHEYNQAGGRAGRRGLDTVGHVIHLNNLFRDVELTGYKNMMKGTPQKLVSKFKISYSLILNLIDIGDTDFVAYAKKSMIQDDIDAECSVTNREIYEKVYQINDISHTLENLGTPLEDVEKYTAYKKEQPTAINRRRKELDKEILQLKEIHPRIEVDMKTVENLKAIQKERQALEKRLNNAENYLKDNIAIIVNFLESGEFIVRDIESGLYALTRVGFIAANMREVHCLVFGRLMDRGRFDPLSAREIIAILSCFTNVAVQEERRAREASKVKDVMDDVAALYEFYQDFESKKQTDTGVNYDLHYDLMDAVLQWTDCESAEDCKRVLQELEYKKEVFLGDFVKALLKINNISAEMEKMAESMGNMDLLNKLKKIPGLTQKYVATNQSLYV